MADVKTKKYASVFIGSYEDSVDLCVRSTPTGYTSYIDFSIQDGVYLLDSCADSKAEAVAKLRDNVEKVIHDLQDALSSLEESVSCIE